jgi:hypothetical protein
MHLLTINGKFEMKRILILTAFKSADNSDIQVVRQTGENLAHEHSINVSTPNDKISETHRGAYAGRKRDAKSESNELRRRQSVSMSKREIES